MRVHDSQAYRKMHVTIQAAHQSYLATEKYAPLIPNCFNLVNAAVVCAILESISGLEPSSVIIEPRY